MILAVQGGCGQLHASIDHDQAGHLQLCACWGAQLLQPGWLAVMGIVGILHGTSGLGLAFVKGSGLDYTACCDADDTDKSIDGRSVSGTVVALGGAAVVWASRTQRNVTLHTTKA